MDIVEQRQQWAADFEREYPEELPNRLRWFTDRLGIRPYHLLRLMGLSRSEAEELAKGPVDWDAAVAKYSEESGWWVEAKVRHLLRRSRWDWRALRDRLHQPPERPFRVPRPAGWTVSPEELPPEERETVLLTLIVADDPASGALMAYLSQPSVSAAHP